MMLATNIHYPFYLICHLVSDTEVLIQNQPYQR